MKKRFFAFGILIFLIVVAFSAYFSIKWLMMPVSNNSEAQKVRFEVPYGTPVLKIISSLKENGLIKNEKLFYAAIKYPQILKFFFPSAQISNIDFKSGTYYLSPAMDYSELLEILSSGQQEYIHVSIPEGLTISKVAALLQEKGICSKDDFTKACHEPSILAEYDIPSDSCEGFLFPDTYFLNSKMDAKSVVKIMLDNFASKIHEIPSAENMTRQELFNIVTLASIVEREYRVKEEAPLIASVFKNRLKQNIGLYSCATIEYIITEIQGREHPKVILIEDTKINNPYNTYKWAGLPPGPISNPGLTALDACFNTPKTNYYFFQIVDPAAGRHVFTSTFDQHVSNHNLYTK